MGLFADTLARFERDLLDGNDLSWTQMLLFVPLMIVMVARSVIDEVREFIRMRRAR